MLRLAHVYILANWKRTTYIGVTTNLPRRLEWHLSGASGGFASKHRLRRLVHVEVFSTPMDGIRREKELKGWRREKKVALIESTNPEWRDMMADWGWRGPLDSASG
jgi:putative endonuclease